MDFFVQYKILFLPLIASLLSSVIAGIVGSLTVVRRSTYVAGAIAHSVLGGMGVAQYLRIEHHIAWCSPTIGAFIAALLSATLIALATSYARERIDSILSIIWAFGMAIGIIFIHKTTGYSDDLMSYLSGSILIVSHGDILLVALLDILIIGLVYLFYNRILTVCFNEESARVQGIPVGLYNYLILIVTALTTVLLAQMVGVIMVIALLSIPATIVSRFVFRLSSMMLWTILLSSILSVTGITLSFFWELPPGATIILIAGVFYIVSITIDILRGKKPTSREQKVAK